jgi:hypothetical protein
MGIPLAVTKIQPLLLTWTEQAAGFMKQIVETKNSVSECVSLQIIILRKWDMETRW